MNKKKGTEKGPCLNVQNCICIFLFIPFNVQLSFLGVTHEIDVPFFIYDIVVCIQL